MSEQETYEPGEVLIYSDGDRTLVVKFVRDRSDENCSCYDLEVVKPIRQFGMKYFRNDTFSCIKIIGSKNHRDNGWTLERIAEGSEIPSV